MARLPNMAMERHKCPRVGCDTQVDNRLFSCHRDWFALSRDCRNMISRTAKLSLLSRERRAAIEMAGHEWALLDAKGGTQ